jgi:hypothetical protein
MKRKEIVERCEKFIKPYCVTEGKKFRLKDIDLVRWISSSVKSRVTSQPLPIMEAAAWCLVSGTPVAKS